MALAGVYELAARLRGRASMLNIDNMREAFAGAWHCSGEQAEREQGWLAGGTRKSAFGTEDLKSANHRLVHRRGAEARNGKLGESA